jgi:PAS domain S-box-containing protein
MLAVPVDASTDLVLRTLIEVSADGLAVLDTQGRFTLLNDAAARILGQPAAELIGRTAPFRLSEDQDITSPEPVHASWRDPNGRCHDLEYRLGPVRGVGYAVWFSDVTKARRQQERLTAITRAASSVADAGSLLATLSAVAREIVLTANIAAVQILAVDNPADELRVLGMAGFGDVPDFTERLAACRRRGAKALFLDAFDNGGPVVVPHRKTVIMADPDWAPLHDIMGRPEWDGFVAMPLVVRGRPVGVINTYYRPGAELSAGSLAFLETMADHAAVAIDTAALLSQARSRAQQDERRRLARDLHDSVVQQLFSMRMHARALRAQLDRADPDPVAMYDGAEALAGLSDSALADLRRLVFELRPMDLSERGLVDAVRAHAASVETRTGLAVQVNAPADLTLGYGIDIQEDLYRIVQEALHNVVKHARAASVEVAFSRIEGGDDGLPNAVVPADGLFLEGLLVEVSDDGSAADPAVDAGTDQPPHLGLVSMRERAERWGGQLVVGPRPGAGWSVAVTLPAAWYAADMAVGRSDE